MTNPCFLKINGSRGQAFVGKNPGGFTLVELIVVMAILGIVITLAVPAMQELSLTQRVKQAAAALHSSLVFARSEAVKRSDNVILTATGGIWVSGWSVRSGATSLRSADAFSGLTITGPAGDVTFKRDGRLSSSGSTFVIYVSGNSSVAMRCVAVGLSGIPAISVDSDQNTSNGCN